MATIIAGAIRLGRRKITRYIEWHLIGRKPAWTQTKGVALKRDIPPDFPSRIKQLRVKLGLTQMRLAELMGLSFASV
jgi:DNA-binding transcriptional regulator YiaG